ncbi:helitron_like_N domain-containing protein [Trichonephila clavipes]|nr:helitron_like_N domain-containing protein [Trichonephila clavipes]
MRKPKVRLRYIKFNQAKLRSEEYIHLCDAIIGNVDAMIYVRENGRPDLFITFTCNPNWDENKNLLFSGQTSMHRHDIIARVFKQKLKYLINLITHHLVFGETRCLLYSVEWQKCGLPHAHILIWLVAKVRPEEIDIAAEIPDPNVDQELFAIVTTNMIHGSCGTLNMSPCMNNGKCTKRFPKPCQTDTITNIDGYPSYRRRDIDNGGQSYELRLSNGVRVDIDKCWVVPYSPLLCKTYKAHINVELCSSVKYICKYVHKGSDKAIFAVQNVNDNDEITRYQMGYICSNEAIWRIFSFPMHERDPAVIHLTVHLENGQLVYFTERTALHKL